MEDALQQRPFHLNDVALLSQEIAGM